MRVLIAEDDDRLARAVAAGLRRRGMSADVAFDGGGALDKLAVNAYDVVVLDRDLPGVLGEVERLGQVVVRAQAQALDPVAHRPGRGEHQDPALGPAGGGAPGRRARAWMRATSSVKSNGLGR